MRSRIVMLSLAACAGLALTTTAHAQSNGECWRHSPATGWSRCSDVAVRREREYRVRTINERVDRAREISERIRDQARERAAALVERRAEDRIVARERSEAYRYRAQETAWKVRERVREQVERAQIRADARALKYRYRYNRQ
jgi:small-conductance mechanosensitive channel